MYIFPNEKDEVGAKAGPREGPKHSGLPGTFLEQGSHGVNATDRRAPACAYDEKQREEMPLPSTRSTSAALEYSTTMRALSLSSSSLHFSV